MHTAHCQKRLLPSLHLYYYTCQLETIIIADAKKLSKNHLPTLVRRQLELIVMKALQLQTTDVKLKIIVYQ